MEIPLELFSLFIIISIALAGIGLWRKIPMLMFLGGFFIAFWSIQTDTIIIDSFQDLGSEDTYSYDITSNTGQVLLNAVTANTRAERPISSSSQLIDDQIDCITIYLGKSGSPPESTITFGVFDTNSALITSFGTQSVASMTSTANTPYTHCLPLGQTHTITTNQFIGVKYNAGDATNTLTMRVDANNPFDGTTTDHAQYLVSWTGNSGQDVMMQMYLRGSESEITNNNFVFDGYAKVMFIVFGAIMLLAGAIVWKLD